MKRMVLAGLAAAGVAIGGGGAAHAQDDQARRARPFTPAWAAPQLEVSPERGRTGTRVVITGSEFGDNARAYYGDRPMRIVQRQEDRIVAVIPRGARGDDYIYVRDETGRARTAQAFDLTGPRRFPLDRRDRFRDDRREHDRRHDHDHDPYDRGLGDPFSPYDGPGRYGPYDEFDPYDWYTPEPYGADPYDPYDPDDTYGPYEEDGWFE